MERSQLETYEDRVPRTAFDFHLLYLVSLKDFFFSIRGAEYSNRDRRYVEVASSSTFNVFLS